MAESIVQVTEGVGKKFHTWSRVVSAQTVEQQFVLPGEFVYATYTVVASLISVATAADHLLQIMAGASLNVRIRRIYVRQAAAVTAASSSGIDVVRLTTAGTGGTAVTPRPLDTADAAAGCTAQTLPTAKGTEGSIVLEDRIGLIQTQPVVDTAKMEWRQSPNAKPLIIPAGVANGIAIKNLNANAGASVTITVELVETAYL